VVSRRARYWRASVVLLLACVVWQWGSARALALCVVSIAALDERPDLDPFGPEFLCTFDDVLYAIDRFDQVRAGALRHLDGHGGQAVDTGDRGRILEGRLDLGDVAERDRGTGGGGDRNPKHILGPLDQPDVAVRLDQRDPLLYEVAVRGRPVTRQRCWAGPPQSPPGSTPM
jgi:hypothetical protein